jgi:hypothetical protein
MNENKYLNKLLILQKQKHDKSKFKIVPDIYWKKNKTKCLKVKIKEKKQENDYCIYEIYAPLKSEPKNFINICQIGVHINDKKEFFEMFIIDKNNNIMKNFINKLKSLFIKNKNKDNK